MVLQSGYFLQHVLGLRSTCYEAINDFSGPVSPRTPRTRARLHVLSSIGSRTEPCVSTHWARDRSRLMHLHVFLQGILVPFFIREVVEHFVTLGTLDRHILVYGSVVLLHCSSIFVFGVTGAENFATNVTIHCYVMDLHVLAHRVVVCCVVVKVVEFSPTIGTFRRYVVMVVERHVS